MKLGGPLRRTTPLKSRTRLAPRSAKTIAEMPEREAVRLRVLGRANGRCQARFLVPDVPCEGRLDVHELKLRSGRRGGHLDDANCVAICRAHHDWVHSHADEAHAVGLRVWSWEKDPG